jgi:hypothetical protein
MNASANQFGISGSASPSLWSAADSLPLLRRKPASHRSNLPESSRPTACILRALILLFVLLALAPSPGPAKPPVVRVPFRSIESMILLEGKVNGDPVTFLLDTGSVGTIVSARMYRITSFPLRSVQRNADGHGINGESISVRLDLQLGNRRWAGQRVSIMNLDELSQILGIRHIDGLIGEDILREFRSIRIDYHTHVIELEE